MTPRQKLVNAIWFVPFKRYISKNIINHLENKGLVGYGIDEFDGNHLINDNYGRKPILKRCMIEIIENEYWFGKYYSEILFTILKRNDIIEEKALCVITLDTKI